MLTPLEHRALARLDRDRIVRLTQDLVRIPTDNPPGSESVAAQFLATELAALGCSTELQSLAPGRANLLACLGDADARPHPILNGHVDTVPAGLGWTRGPYSGEVVEGRLFGRGSADMKGGVAAMLAAVEALVGSQGFFAR